MIGSKPRGRKGYVPDPFPETGTLAYCITHDRTCDYNHAVNAGSLANPPTCDGGVKPAHWNTCSIVGPFETNEQIEQWKMMEEAATARYETDFLVDHLTD